MRSKKLIEKKYDELERKKTVPDKELIKQFPDEVFVPVEVSESSVNKLFNSITPEIEKDISDKEDFDFHTSSILKLLGMKGSFNTMQALIGGEIKRLVQSKA